MVFFRNSDEAVRLLYTRQLGEPLRANPGEVSMISTLLMDDDVVRPQVDAGAERDVMTVLVAPGPGSADVRPQLVASPRAKSHLDEALLSSPSPPGVEEVAAFSDHSPSPMATPAQRRRVSWEMDQMPATDALPISGAAPARLSLIHI